MGTRRSARRVDADRAGVRSTTTYHPVSSHADVASRGDETPIDWVHRERRFGEAATPDTSIADLIEVDHQGRRGPVPVRQLTIHPARARAPRDFRDQRASDLASGLVGLLNVLEERDVQIRLQDPPSIGMCSSHRQRGLHQPQPPSRRSRTVRRADRTRCRSDRSRGSRSSGKRYGPRSRAVANDRACVHDGDHRRDQPARWLRVNQRSIVGALSIANYRRSSTRPGARTARHNRACSDLGRSRPRREDRDRDARRRYAHGARSHRRARARGVRARWRPAARRRVFVERFRRPHGRTCPADYESSQTTSSSAEAGVLAGVLAELRARAVRYRETAGELDVDLDAPREPVEPA